MEHDMKLHPAPFTAIRTGTKTIEMRLCDEKRSLFCVGDLIIFTNTATNEKLYCTITALYRYRNFEELYKTHDKLSLGYAKNELAAPSDMHAYYSSEQIEKYGVLAIELQI